MAEKRPISEIDWSGGKAPRIKFLVERTSRDLVNGPTAEVEGDKGCAKKTYFLNKEVVDLLGDFLNKLLRYDPTERDGMARGADAQVIPPSVQVHDCELE